jgi:hypothetical protein
VAEDGERVDLWMGYAEKLVEVVEDGMAEGWIGVKSEYLEFLSEVEL